MISPDGRQGSSNLFWKTLLLWLICVSFFFTAIFMTVVYGRSFVGSVDAKYVITEAESLIAESRHDDARLMLENLIRDQGQNLKARILLLRLLDELGRYDEMVAIANASREIASGEELLPVLQLHAKALYGTANWISAQSTLDEILKQDPNNIEARYLMAQVLRALGKYKKMINSLVMLPGMSLDGASPEFVRLMTTRRARSVPENQKVVHPTSGHELLEAASDYRLSGRWDAAMELYEACANMPSPPADCLFWLGVQSEANDEIDSAASYYRRAIDILPTHLEALRALTRLENEKK